MPIYAFRYKTLTLITFVNPLQALNPSQHIQCKNLVLGVPQFDIGLRIVYEYDDGDRWFKKKLKAKHRRNAK
ncbi:hypothetical protein Mapa_009331 [Marchantia paleacea]|nr:hypothetical protein Mapa_009331 [Marchantia paleacea]